MSRQVESWGTLGATLRTLVAGAPPWVADDTREAAAVLYARLRRDVAAVVAGASTRAAAATLGIAHRTLMRARADGWLSGE